jgi:hypothetical protein
MTGIDFAFMLSVVLSGALSLLLIAMLTIPVDRPDKPGVPEFIPPERVGMGIIASASMMLMPRLYMQAATPFEPWATTLLWSGALLFFAARAYRAWRHRFGNWLQVKKGLRQK